MSPADLDLARRAVACKGWRWMPRMRTAEGYTVMVVRDTRHGQAHVVTDWATIQHLMDLSSCVPDLADPATLGCLLALVREAHACSTAWVWFSTAEGWIVTRGDGDRIGEGPTEAAALVAALESAP